MSDELKEKIAKTLFDWIDDDGWEWEEVDEAIKNHYRGKADSILSLLAPELADAEKWKKVMEVYHKDDERFVQFANTISKIRELDALTEKEAL